MINLGGYEFSEPKLLANTVLSNVGGIYSILCPTKDLDTLELLYIGITDNFYERISPNHHKYDCWTRKTKPQKLYVSIHKTPNKTIQRLIENKLINKFTPICND